MIGWTCDTVLGTVLATALYYFVVGPIHFWWVGQIVSWLWRL